MTGLTAAQQRILMMPLNPARVVKKQGKFSYLEAWDVKAMLIRVFGFGGFSADVVTADLMFQLPPGEPEGSKNWDIGYRVILQLSIPQLNCTYTEAAIGTAHLPDIGEAHDMAIKTAESDALKRAAIYLGTQYGLGLYSDGSTRDVVGVAGIPVPLVGPAVPDSGTPTASLPATMLQPAEYEPTVSVSDPEVPTLGEAMATVVDSLGATVAADGWLESLRSYAKEPDSSKRILGVAGLKAAATPELLRTTTNVNGTTMTYGMLADKVAAGAFL